MISGQKIIVFGLGIEGLSAVKYLSKQNEITVIDDKRESEINRQFITEAKNYKAKLLLGENKNLSEYNLIVRSPGVNPNHATIKYLISKGATLTSATKIFFSEFKGEIIGVTGTKGKGTTSTLIYELLKTEQGDVFLAGNIGNPMLDLLPKIKKTTKIVLELSSFQLIDLKSSPHVSVILMITSEHLDWHKNTTEYLNSKSNLADYQTNKDYCVINRDFVNSLQAASRTRAKKYFFSTKRQTNGVYLKGNKIISKISRIETVCNTSDVVLPGAHNLQNIAAGVAVAKIYGISNKSILKVIKSFMGLQHRLQLVGIKKRVKYYNDSFSTTPETTIAAIESFENPKVLILGGSSKNSDFTSLVLKIKNTPSLRTLILIGKEGKRIKNLLKSKNVKTPTVDGLSSMKKIVLEAQKESLPGGIVLLSPGCASFDMFKNYKDRGNQFITEVKKL